MHRVSVRWMMGLLVWCCLTGSASAVSLGNIEIASHLGEPFFARVDVHLAEGESMDKVQASIAEASDYRILEIYRDHVVAGIRVARKNDGSPLLELSSSKPVDVPFFNLVLKLSYERFTQFKKFPVFLELPKAVQPKAAGRKAPVATLKAKGPEVVPIVLQPAAEAAAGKQEQKKSGDFKPFDGWARASVYGPIVRGDMLSTVAQRLKIDDRYTLAQVVVALYEKNPDKFNVGNLNLLKKGAMLKVPTRAEIEKHTPAEASRIFRQHLDRWQELVKKPRYAAEKRAQETRYSPRIRVGEKAEVMHRAATTVAAAEPQKTEKTSAENQPPALTDAAGTAAETKTSVVSDEAATPKDGQVAQAQTALPAQQASGRDAVADHAAIAEKAAPAAATPKINHQLNALQLKVKQMQLQLAMLQEEKRQDAEIMQWVLLGMAILIVILLLALLFALRRKPAAEASATALLAASRTIVEDAPAQEVNDAQAAGQTPQTEKAAEAPSSASVESAEEHSSEAPAESGSSLKDTPLPSPSEAMEAPENVPADVSNPDIDHLADADVYLRYGMEDEAMKMVELALQADPQRVDAHIKKILILSFFAREEELQRSIAESMQAIPAEEQERFIVALRDMGLDDVLPTMTGEGDTSPEQDVALHAAEEEIADTHEADVADVTDEVRPETQAQAAHDVMMPEEGRQTEAEQENASCGPESAAAEAATPSAGELEFDVSGLDLEEVSVGSHLPRESGLVAEDEALNFDFDGLAEAGQEEQTPQEEQQEQPDQAHVRKLDHLLDQLEKDDDESQR